MPADHILWLGFDDERLVNMKADELDEVITSYMEMYPDTPVKDVHMFFDEIQLISGWEYFVLRVYKSYCKNVFVCGSNATMLSTELASALRGYPLEYVTYPLSFNEYCRFKGVNTSSFLEQDRAKVRNAFLSYCCDDSSYPEVVLTRSKSEQIKLLHGYFDTMILKDLAEHYSISNIAMLRYFIKRIMANLTKPTSINAIYNDIRSQGFKVSKDNMYLWANYACDIFMFIRIPKYNRSLAKVQKSLDKYYCIDNGLRSVVLMPQSDDSGKKLENVIFLELNRRYAADDSIFYYQGTDECDFVLQRGDTVSELIQVTWDMSDYDTRQREVAGLIEASEVTGCDKLTIITVDEETTINETDKTIHVIPAWKRLLQ